MASGSVKENSFKLPASSIDEVFKIVQGYATVGRPAPLSDISKNTGMHPTVVSRNVGFLLSLGLLEGGKNKSPTAVGSKLGLALMHNVPEEVESILSDIVSENEFLKNVLAAVRIRRGMDTSSLRSHVAYSAGQSKTGSTTTGTGAVIELLKRSGQLKEEDGKLIVASPILRAAADPITPEKDSIRSSTILVENETSSINSITLSINIDVRCEAKDLDTLGEKLRRIMNDLEDRDQYEFGEE